MKMTFGKYKNLELDSRRIPSSYLIWIFETTKQCDPELKIAMKEELLRRITDVELTDIKPKKWTPPNPSKYGLKKANLEKEMDQRRNLPNT